MQRLAKLSAGTEVPNPRHLQRRLKQITRLHRVVSRRQNGSQNRQQAVRILRKLYRKGAHQRHDTVHQLTTRLTTTTSVIVIEDRHVAGMLQNHHVAQASADVGCYAFQRQVLYKAERRSGTAAA